MTERDLRRAAGRSADDGAWGHWPDEDEYGYEDDLPEGGRDWRRPQGIFVIAPIGGAAGERIADIQKRYDPKLAASQVPHVTLVGSSGVGPIQAGTGVDRLLEALEPIARSMAPITVRFSAPTRFMQTNIVSLPLDPNGPVRALYERIRSSGLSFLPARFAFTPHATLSYFPTLDRSRERELLALRVTEPAVVDRFELSLTDDPRPPRRLLELKLEG
ncbi:MAG TPA: 2'-5' RNA ligase family protein [Gemmatimonadales bacterium]